MGGTIMATGEKKISELTPLPSDVTPAAIVPIVQSGVTYGVAAQKIVDAVAGNMTADDVDTLLKREVAIRVSSAAVVVNHPLRTAITATRTSEGVYELTTPLGVWQSAVITHNRSGGAPAVFMVSGWDTATITVRAYTLAGALSDEHFVLQGTLKTDD